MHICGYGGMADALGSGPSGGNSMEVQVLLTAPKRNKLNLNHCVNTPDGEIFVVDPIFEFNIITFFSL